VNKPKLGEVSSKLYAIKVIKRETLLMKSDYEQGQMISEIRAMRSLDRCEGTVRLFKVFESDNYLNLLMEY
jgi:serine/threonine protein kinase